MVTKHETYREDIERRLVFEKYIKRHYSSWVDFAREQGHDSNPKPVLVTGFDLTRDFAMVAYSNNSVRMECEFSAAVPAVASASLSLWGRWRTEGLVHTNCGPPLLAVETTSSSNSDDHATPVSIIPRASTTNAYLSATTPCAGEVPFSKLLKRVLVRMILGIATLEMIPPTPHASRVYRAGIATPRTWWFTTYLWSVLRS